MKCLRIVRNAAVALAAIGMMVPNAPASAAGPSVAGRANVKVVNAQIYDIALGSQGTFRGRVVDHTGAPIEGAAVSVLQGKKEIAKTVTDKSGSFAVGQLSGGIYTVASGATEGTYRAWSENSAPPSAKPQSLLVLGQNGTRGNFGSVDTDGAMLLTVVTAVAVAAIVVGAVALSNANRALNRQPASP